MTGSVKLDVTSGPATLTARLLRMLYGNLLDLNALFDGARVGQQRRRVAGSADGRRRFFFFQGVGGGSWAGWLVVVGCLTSWYL